MVMISSILSRPLEVVSRLTLEALVKNSMSGDLSQYSDDELKDLILELYPRDVLSSLSFARRGIEMQEDDSEKIDALNLSTTSIDMILGDRNWCYVFWNISSYTLSEIIKDDENYSIFLRVHENVEKDGERKDEYFDIEIHREERERNIYIQGQQASFYTELYARCNGKEIFLSKSEVYRFSLPYFLKHMDEKPSLLFFEPFLNQDNNLVLSNALLESFYNKYKTEDTFEKK